MSRQSEPANDRGKGVGYRQPGLVDDPCAVVREAAEDRPFVVAQLGQSLDGRIATATGQSRWINREAAIEHLHRLRACVDAVVVGVGTVLADNPRLTVRRVKGRNPARVVIDPSGRLPAEARCLEEDGAARLVVRAQGAAALPGVEMIFMPRCNGALAPAEIVTVLFRRGLRRILVEGGARTISRFIEAGVIDRLHLMVSPVILGSGKCGLELSPIDKVAEARRPATRVYLLADGDVLFDCDLRRNGSV